METSLIPQMTRQQQYKMFSFVNCLALSHIKLPKKGKKFLNKALINYICFYSPISGLVVKKYGMVRKVF